MIHCTFSELAVILIGVLMSGACAVGPQGMLTEKAFRQAKTLLLTCTIAGTAVVVTLVTGYVMASPTFGWTGAEPSRAPTWWSPDERPCRVVWAPQALSRVYKGSHNLDLGFKMAANYLMRV